MATAPPMTAITALTTRNCACIHTPASSVSSIQQIGRAICHGDLKRFRFVMSQARIRVRGQRGARDHPTQTGPHGGIGRKDAPLIAFCELSFGQDRVLGKDSFYNPNPNSIAFSISRSSANSSAPAEKLSSPLVLDETPAWLEPATEF